MQLKVEQATWREVEAELEELQSLTAQVLGSGCNVGLTEDEVNSL
jgi:hypothetical protein